MSFADAIATGLAAAEDAWGQAWSPDGTTLSFEGSFDRLDDASSPADGGYRPEFNATIVTSVRQLEAIGITTMEGLPIVGVEGETITMAGGIIEQFLRIGQKIVTGGKTYRITGRATDFFTVDLRLASIDR